MKTLHISNNVYTSKIESEMLKVIIDDSWEVQEVPVSLEFLEKIGVADKCLGWHACEERYIVSRDTYNSLMRIDMATWIWDEE